MRVTSHTHLTIATIILAFAFTCYGASVSEPNKPSAEKTSPREVSSHAQNDSGAIRTAKAELSRDYYKDCVDNLKWALGIMITLVVVFTATITGYLIFRNTREYRQALIELKEALSQARQAGKEARDASDKARDWEEKAREKLASIDEKVETKLREIEGKSRTLKTDLIQEVKKQREVSRERAEEQQYTFSLLAKALSAINGKKYELAVSYYKQILEIDPENTSALNNWAYTLLVQAQTKKGKEKIQLIDEAKEKCLKIESIKTGEGAYNLACIHSILGEEEECKKWLKIVEQGGTLTNRLITREKAMADPDLENVRDKKWFKQINWKGD